MVVQHGLQIFRQGVNDGLNVEAHTPQGLLLYGEVLAPGSHLQGGRKEEMRRPETASCPLSALALAQQTSRCLCSGAKGKEMGSCQLGLRPTERDRTWNSLTGNL